jgi:hypothetical protein
MYLFPAGLLCFVSLELLNYVCRQLLFDEEICVSIKKNENIQNYNFACGSVWMQNLVSKIKGGT